MTPNSVSFFKVLLGNSENPVTYIISIDIGRIMSVCWLGGKKVVDGKTLLVVKLLVVESY